MGSKMQTGLLLVLGAVVSAIGWVALYPADGTASVVEQAQKIMGDPDIAKAGIILGFGGCIAIFIGIFNIARGMAAAGGKGSSYGNVVFILSVALIAVSVVGAGLELGTAGATSAAGGVTLMGVSVALGSSLGITMAITLILLGVGIALDKNLHIIAAATGIITGGLVLSSSFVDSDPLLMAGWVGFYLTALVLGGLTLRSNS